MSPFLIECFGQLSGKKVRVVVMAHVDQEHLLQLLVVKLALLPAVHHQGCHLYKEELSKRFWSPIKISFREKYKKTESLKFFQINKILPSNV